MSQTVINNPDSGGNDNGGGGSNLIIGVVVAIIFLVVLFIFIIPALQNDKTNSAPSDVNIDVPKSIDVNVDSGSDSSN